MIEILILKLLLFVGLIIAPIQTNHFFLKNSRAYSDAHKIAIYILLCGQFLNLILLFLIWPLFCLFGFLLFLRNEYKTIFSVPSVAFSIPFIFSLISSLWMVSGILDLRLLGYDPLWSLYAALHGCFLGWLFVGSIAFLYKRESRKIYLASCYLIFFCFLLVAFGINGVPYIKRLGVVGLSLILPVLIADYLFHLKVKNSSSVLFAALSFLSLVSSMILALCNEFYPGFPREIAGKSFMAMTHGILNAIITIPCLTLSLLFEKRRTLHQTKKHDSIIFFDDICVLCSRTVQILIKLDQNLRLKYSSLDGKIAKSLPSFRDKNAKESVVFWSNGVLYTRTDAVIHILITLGGIYSILGSTLKLFPLFVLDLIYDLIAKHRYQIFGKRETCFLPTKESKDRFLT